MIIAPCKPTSTTPRVGMETKKRAGNDRSRLVMERAVIAKAGNALPTVMAHLRKAIAVAQPPRIRLRCAPTMFAA